MPGLSLHTLNAECVEHVVCADQESQWPQHPKTKIWGVLKDAIYCRFQLSYCIFDVQLKTPRQRSQDLVKTYKEF